MSRYDDDLFRMFRSLQIGNDVIPGSLRKVLWCQSEVHAHTALGGKTPDQVGIFGGERCRGNRSGVAESRVRKPVLGTAYRADKRCGAPEFGDRSPTSATIDDCFSIGFESVARGCLVLVIGHVEKDDLACHLSPSQSR